MAKKGPFHRSKLAHTGLITGFDLDSSEGKKGLAKGMLARNAFIIKSMGKNRPGFGTIDCSRYI
jgi:hypothetical protein